MAASVPAVLTADKPGGGICLEALPPARHCPSHRFRFSARARRFAARLVGGPGSAASAYGRGRRGLAPRRRRGCCLSLAPLRFSARAPLRGAIGWWGLGALLRRTAVGGAAWRRAAGGVVACPSHRFAFLLGRAASRRDWLVGLGALLRCTA